MEQDIIFTSESWLPIFYYYGISLALFSALLFGKVKVNKRNCRALYILYTVFIMLIGVVQFCLFVHGTSFLKGFLHINYDIDNYLSIRFGALAFAILYLLLTLNTNRVSRY